MSGNDYIRCGICGAVSLDEPLPCGHKTEVEQLREALIACDPCVFCDDYIGDGVCLSACPAVVLRNKALNGEYA